MKNTFTTIKVLTLLIIIAVGASYAFADFAAPAGSAPSANLSVPVHTGFDQVKTGGLGVNTFVATDNAQFDGAPTSVFFGGTVLGGNPINPARVSTVIPTVADIVTFLKGAAAPIVAQDVGIGGTVWWSTTSSEHFNTSAVTTGPIFTKESFTGGNIYADPLLFATQRDRTELCADATGTVVLCNPSTTPPAIDLCTNVQGIQTGVPTGMYVTTSGLCLFPGNMPTSDDYCPNIPGAQRDTFPSQYYDPSTGKTFYDTSYFDQNYPINETTLTALLNKINARLRTDKMEAGQAHGEQYADAMDAVNAAIIAIKGKTNSYGVSTDLNIVYGAINGLKPFDHNDQNPYPKYASDLKASYKSTLGITVTQLSYDSSWNCLPVPSIQKVIIAQKNGTFGPQPSAPVTLTLSSPALTGQVFEMWGYETPSGSNHTHIRRISTTTISEGQSTASFNTLTGYDYYCIRPQTVPPFLGIPANGARPAGTDRWWNIYGIQGTTTYGIGIGAGDGAQSGGQNCTIAYPTDFSVNP